MVASSVMPAFGADGHLPCGRFQIDMDMAYELLVADQRFATSGTRSDLWDKLTEYLLLFDEPVRLNPEASLGRPIIRHLWLAGSFVSTKIDPSDIDLTVFTDAEVIAALKSKPGAKWITEAFNRRKIQPEFRLDPYQVNYRPVPHVFQLRGMSPADQEYFRDRGRYDDWWQRRHPPGTMDKQPPTIDSCVPARGYLEVTL